MTEDEFTQSIGIGTMTPGPIFFAAAIFIGYRLRGIRGAVTAGLGVLLPSFVLVVVIATLYARVEECPWVIAITQGIAAGVVGLFLSVVVKTGRATAKNLWGAVWVLLAFVAVAFFKLAPLLLIVIAGAAGACFLRPTPRIVPAEK